MTRPCARTRSNFDPASWATAMDPRHSRASNADERGWIMTVDSACSLAAPALADLPSGKRLRSLLLVLLGNDQRQVQEVLARRRLAERPAVDAAHLIGQVVGDVGAGEEE